MFRIGEFAQIAQVSGRLLRYYDQIGLLQPVRIDPQTGYRYYSARQLPRLNRILALKSLGLTLDRIAILIDGEIGPEEMRGMLMLRKSQVERTLEEEHARLREIESRIQQIDEDGAVGDFDIVVKAIAAQPFLSVRRRCPDMDQAIAVLRQVVAAGSSKLPARIRDRLVVVAHNDFAGEALDLALGFSLTERVNKTIRLGDGLDMTIGDLPAVGEMATVVRSGPNYQSHRAFGSLGTWIEANGYRIAAIRYDGRELLIRIAPNADPAFTHISQ